MRERKEGSTGAEEGGSREVRRDDLHEAAQEPKEWLQNHDARRVGMSSWKTNTRGDRWVLRLQKPHGKGTPPSNYYHFLYTRDTKAVTTDTASRSKH